MTPEKYEYLFDWMLIAILVIALVSLIFNGLVIPTFYTPDCSNDKDGLLDYDLVIGSDCEVSYLTAIPLGKADISFKKMEE